MRNNVTLTGIMGSGKSHVANILEANGWEVFKFATPLKEIIETAFDLERGEIEHLKTSRIEFEEFPMYYAVVMAEEILIKMGVSKFGAKARINEPSVMTSPIPSLGGLTGEQMVFEIKDLLTELRTMRGTYRELLQRLGTDLMRSWNEDIHVEFARNAIQKKKLKKPLVIDDARFMNEIEYARKELKSEVVWLHRPSLVHKDFHSSETSISQKDADLVILSQEGELLSNAVNYYVDRGEFPKELHM